MAAACVKRLRILSSWWGTCLLCLLPPVSLAQVQIGIELAVTTAWQRVAVTAAFAQKGACWQWHTAARLAYYPLHWSEKQGVVEGLFLIGGRAGWGKKTMADSTAWYLPPVFGQNLTQRANIAGYDWYFFIDNAHTGQAAGAVALQSGKWLCYFFNDLLGAPAQDRYRTAAVWVEYHRGQERWQLQHLLWTGDTRRASGVRSATYPAQVGFLDMRMAPYGLSSHGILALTYVRYGPQAPPVSLSIGLDAEQIRHWTQNRLMHDMIFLPKPWRTDNYHVPMIADDGTLFLFEENQHVRPARLFLGMGVGSFFRY
jgi:hypothetical protein